MAVRMNTFAVVLLAFPFYLAVKGRLAGYIALAKPSHATAPPLAAASPSAAAPAPASAQAAPSAASAPSGETLSQAMAAISTFANTSGVGAAS